MKYNLPTRFVLITATIIALMTATLTVFANPPTEGTVVEGYSIPGDVTLNDTRAEAESVLGRPLYCQGPNQYFCNYEMGIVIRYENKPSNPNNKIETISWSSAHTPQWETTAGATLQLLLDDAIAFAELYPSAQVTGYPEMADTKVRVYVPELGIDFSRNPIRYGPGATTSGVIFAPIGSSPSPEPTTMPEPTSEPEPTAMPEPTSEPEPTTMPEPTSEPEPTAMPEPTPEPELPSTVITLFDGKNFREGRKGSFDFGTGTVSGSDVGNARYATSVRVPDGLQVTLCSNSAGTKNCQTYTEDENRMPKGLRNRVKFIQVSAN